MRLMRRSVQRRLDCLAIHRRDWDDVERKHASYADNRVVTIDELGGCIEFVDCDGGVIFADLIPKDEWPEMVKVDARYAGQYANGQIPGAINIGIWTVARYPKGATTSPRTSRCRPASTRVRSQHRPVIRCA